MLGTEWSLDVFFKNSAKIALLQSRLGNYTKAVLFVQLIVMLALLSGCMATMALVSQPSSEWIYDYIQTIEHAFLNRDGVLTVCFIGTQVDNEEKEMLNFKVALPVNIKGNHDFIQKNHQHYGKYLEVAGDQIHSGCPNHLEGSALAIETYAFPSCSKIDNDKKLPHATCPEFDRTPLRLHSKTNEPYVVFQIKKNSRRDGTNIAYVDMIALVSESDSGNKQTMQFFYPNQVKQKMFWLGPLLPFAVIIDVVTLPIQAAYLGIYQLMHPAIPLKLPR